MLTVAIPKRNKLQNIIVLTPKDGDEQLYQIGNTAFFSRFRNRSRDACCLQADRYAEKTFVLRQNVEQYSGYFVLVIGWFAAFYRFISVQLWQNPLFYAGRCCFWWNFCKFCVK